MVDIPKREQHVVVLLGPPGSGKGTQAKFITQKFDIPHISTGDILRENIKNTTELGVKAKEYMNGGRLVPDALVLDMLFKRISHDDCCNGYLLDGFPRTIPQAEMLDQFLKNQEPFIAINLTVSNDVLIKRISGRLSCPSCGFVHNQYFSAPIIEGVCDKCGGSLIQRPDDAPEVVKERLNIYLQQTAPLIDFYKMKGVLHTIKGEGDPGAVSSLIIKKILQS